MSSPFAPLAPHDKRRIAAALDLLQAELDSEPAETVAERFTFEELEHAIYALSGAGEVCLGLLASIFELGAIPDDLIMAEAILGWEQANDRLTHILTSELEG